jgi:hypothetical protein
MDGPDTAGWQKEGFFGEGRGGAHIILDLLMAVGSQSSIWPQKVKTPQLIRNMKGAPNLTIYSIYE